MLFKGPRVHHGDKSFLHAAPRITLGYHKEVHHHQTVIHEAKSDRPARVGMLVMAAYFAFEHREAITAHGGRLVRAAGGALQRAGTWARHRIDSGAAEALRIEEAKIVTPEAVPSSAGEPEKALHPDAS